MHNLNDANDGKVTEPEPKPRLNTATVRDFKDFCTCPTPRLDKNDVCRRCGTQWTVA